jgi:hypothetical protein
MERATGGARGRTGAPRARAASRRGGDPQRPAAAGAEPDLRRPAERVASAVVRARRFDAAVEAGAAFTVSRITTAGEWRVLV